MPNLPIQFKAIKGLSLVILCIVLYTVCVQQVEGHRGKSKEGRYICRSGTLCGSSSRSCRRIRYDQLCDGHTDCPCGEDEHICRPKEPSCSGPETLTNFKIPEPLPMSEFEKYIGDIKSQFVFGASFTSVLENTEYRIEKVNTTSYVLSKYTQMEGTQICVQGDNVLMSLMMDGTKARFNSRIAAMDALEVYWSSCPDQYMWGMDCFGWLPGQTTCPPDKVAVFLLLAKLGRPTNVSLLSAFRDVKDHVGIEFGDSNLRWKIDFGENTVCNHRG